MSVLVNTYLGASELDVLKNSDEIACKMHVPHEAEESTIVSLHILAFSQTGCGAIRHKKEAKGIVAKVVQECLAVCARKAEARLGRFCVLAFRKGEMLDKN